MRGQIKDKPYRDALRMEIAAAGEDSKLLRQLARKQLAMAAEGDLNAIKDIADRLDGKPAQMVSHETDDHQPITAIIREIVYMPPEGVVLEDEDLVELPKLGFRGNDA